MFTTQCIHESKHHPANHKYVQLFCANQKKIRKEYFQASLAKSPTLGI
jgi:hypothetical protein